MMKTFINHFQAFTRPGLTWLFSCALIYGVLTRVDLTHLELLYLPTSICLGIWFGNRWVPNPIDALKRKTPAS